jgi:hypothetical protein
LKTSQTQPLPGESLAAQTKKEINLMLQTQTQTQTKVLLSALLVAPFAAFLDRFAAAIDPETMPYIQTWFTRNKYCQVIQTPQGFALSRPDIFFDTWGFPYKIAYKLSGSFLCCGSRIVTSPLIKKDYMKEQKTAVIYLPDLTVLFDYSLPDPCKHARKTINETGSLHFYAGDVIDNTAQSIVCLDCGATLPDPAPRVIFDVNEPAPF